MKSSNVIILYRQIIAIIIWVYSFIVYIKLKWHFQLVMLCYSTHELVGRSVTCIKSIYRQTCTVQVNITPWWPWNSDSCTTTLYYKRILLGPKFTLRWMIRFPWNLYSELLNDINWWCSIQYEGIAACVSLYLTEYFLYIRGWTFDAISFKPPIGLAMLSIVTYTKETRHYWIVRKPQQWRHRWQLTCEVHFFGSIGI